jgi:hypothetical protein
MPKITAISIVYKGRCKSHERHLSSPPPAIRVDSIPHRFGQRLLKLARPAAIDFRSHIWVPAVDFRPHIWVRVWIMDQGPQPLLFDRSRMGQPWVLTSATRTQQAGEQKHRQQERFRQHGADNDRPLAVSRLCLCGPTA